MTLPRIPARPLRIAAIGECMLELSARGEGWSLGHAGDTFNTLWMLRAILPQPAETDFVTAFGDDPFSDRQRTFMGDHGIGTAHSPRIPGLRPGLYAITLTEAGERSFTYWRSASAARRLADDAGALRSILSNRTLIHVSGITLAILDDAGRATLMAALAQARAGGSLISFDPNWRPSLWAGIAEARRAITQALALCDIALPTWADEQDLFGDATPVSACARLHALGVGEIALKQGAEGATIAVNGLPPTAVAACKVTAPVDTTGAGDAFNGAYLAARLTGQGPVDAAQIAHRLAAQVIGVRGALADPSHLARVWSRQPD